MSWQPAKDPQPGDALACRAIESVIVPRARDLGGFEVRRALPSPRRQMVGPFIFWDEMGPAEFRLGQAVDVRPHPHIGLATVPYLFDGEIIHRDSLGTLEPIRPGALNLMTAGKGIVHSEGTAGGARRLGGGGWGGGEHGREGCRSPELGRASPQPRGGRARLRALRRGPPAGALRRR